MNRVKVVMHIWEGQTKIVASKKYSGKGMAAAIH
jgi:hypothetical protein